jgi:hypothetical protein
MADSEGEENTMHTEQSRLVRQSMEATAHPDVYARRKVAALGAVLARTDVPLASAEKVVEVVLDAVGTQDLVTEHRERRAAEGDHDDPDHCTCPTSAPDAFGNCDLIERDDCPVHGSGYLPGEAPEIGPDSADTRLQGIDPPPGQFLSIAANERMANLGRRREGWRGRLAHVEMLLATGRLRVGNVIPVEIDQALAEVRAMMDEG